MFNRGTESICSSSKAKQQILHLNGTAALEMDTHERPRPIQLSLAPLAKLKPAQIFPLLSSSTKTRHPFDVFAPQSSISLQNSDSLPQLAYLALHHLDFLIKARVKHFFPGYNKELNLS